MIDNNPIQRTSTLSTASLSLIVALSAMSFFAGSVNALPAAEQTLSLPELSLLENRFFSHYYNHDPVEKRLERLECLVFGATRSGSNKDRLSRLSQAVALRSATPLPSEKSAQSSSPAKPGSSASAKIPTGSTQYPILSTLEWKLLKKTYVSESLDQRLDRLESRLFGQPAQTMAYIDRVDRLKKTLGIELPGASSNRGDIARGPMPRSRAESRDTSEFGFPENDFGNAPFANPNFSALPIQPAFPGMRGMGLDTMFGGTFDKQFQRMFEEMNKQMSESRRLGPGTWIFDPKTGAWVDMQTGKRKPVSPGAGGRPFSPSEGLKIQPPQNHTPALRDIPAYSDPNSI